MISCLGMCKMPSGNSTNGELNYVVLNIRKLCTIISHVTLHVVYDD